MISNAQLITGTGTPILVAEKRHGNGLIVSQGDSYLLIGTDELEPLIDAMRNVVHASTGRG
jgi:hypothetical protein